jgi:hypothetical protein
MAPAVLVSVFLFWLLPFGALLGGFMIPAALVAIGLSTLFWVMMSAGLGIPAPYGLLYPLGAALSAWIAGRSIWRGSRRIEWRGRRYTLPAESSVASRP